MAQLPLSGIRVLDLTRLLPGAICTLMLADLGAEVIKVESPDGGDYARWMPPLIDGQGAYFQATNRGKKSLILNLKLEAGQEVLHRLAQTADVLVESYRPGVLARMRADAETLRGVNPRLIYCSMSGWGQTGAYAQRSGHDLNYAGLSGVIGEGVQVQPVGGQFADVSGAYVAYGGILTALFQRVQTGRGSVIDASLADAALPVGSYAWVESIAESRGERFARGVLSGRYACYNTYTTSDGLPVALAALEPKFWANFCTAVERSELIALHLMAERQPYLITEVAEIFAQASAAAWDQRLAAVDCCYSRVLRPAELLDDPGIRERGVLMLDAHDMPVVRTPVRLDAGRVPVGAAPGFGEHTDEILRSMNYSDEAIASLRSQSVTA